MAYTLTYWMVRTLLTLYTLALIARAVLPMLGVSYAHPAMRLLWNITEPLLHPIRRRLPPMGQLDLSPAVLLLILWIAASILLQILGWLLL
ncbi:MAG: YggT family protein [Anaerolineae bacterium]|nr:YggT family protein [Anaerolineae bacterium]